MPRFGILLTMVSFGIILLIPIQAYAEPNYALKGQRIWQNPTICAIEPDFVSETDKKSLLTQARNVVTEWETKLQESNKKTAKYWDMTYRELSYQEGESDSNKQNPICDIYVLFQPYPTEGDLPDGTAGYALYEDESRQSMVVIFVNRVGICTSTDDFYIYYNRCYLDQLRSPTVIGNIIRHELGHAFGLGHYTDTTADMSNWILSGALVPSIMIPNFDEATTLLQIRPADIRMMHDLYGPYGFLHESEGILKVNPFDSFDVSNKDSDIITFNGMVTKEQFARGQNVLLDITSPDGAKKEYKAYITDGRMFSLQIRIDDNIKPGAYTIQGRYMGYSSDVIPFVITKEIQKEILTEDYSIPDWIRNNAKWWAENKISNDDFVSGIQYLIKHDIISIPKTTQGISQNDQIPSWIKTNAGWWADGIITDSDFVNGVQHLIQTGILRVS
ncbi:MAG: hypothetical protein DWQ18_04650 [Crenarchaeota archaeon]|nr:MAG: hypothetical protein DWQ17_08480 [Thermoproteota archaeon]RDJ34189.1 MAG: hypothetical protein DWQ18_04650 [Thermoproteota archaeon]RDJ36696.1 MAG: hypothetical protein DWQ13_05960 [Thermoproteota archaeon]RDJ37771.1 MAG: hypothetical protein DWQ19_04875 [Thermoproteota archaeon]